MTARRARGRHAAGRPVAELLEQAADQEWDTSLISVHVRWHRPRVSVPTPELPSRWTLAGDLDFDEDPPTLVRRYASAAESAQPEPSTLTELWFGQHRTAC